MSDIVQKICGFSHPLRHDGMDYGDYFEQLTHPLRLKMAGEQGAAVPNNLDWPTPRGRAVLMLPDKPTPHMLARAFCGQLVSQDQNDEPTEKLLERMRQQGGSK